VLSGRSTMPVTRRLEADNNEAALSSGLRRRPGMEAGIILILFTKRLGVRFAVRVEELLAALLLSII
jgi:hypothetical protein